MNEILANMTLSLYIYILDLKDTALIAVMNRTVLQ